MLLLISMGSPRRSVTLIFMALLPRLCPSVPSRNVH